VSVLVAIMLLCCPPVCIYIFKWKWIFTILSIIVLVLGTFSYIRPCTEPPMNMGTVMLFVPYSNVDMLTNPSSHRLALSNEVLSLKFPQTTVDYLYEDEMIATAEVMWHLQPS